MTSCTWLLALLLPAAQLCAQQPVISAQPEPRIWTAAEDRQNMMDQLGIKSLRPGPSGNESAPNHANYDESLANPFPQLPEALTLKNGYKVTPAKMSWEQRRPKLAQNFNPHIRCPVPTT